MPAAWSDKDERMYQHILDSCMSRGKKGEKTCKRIAAATVNKQRRTEGRALSGAPVSKTKPKRKPLGATMDKNRCRIVKTTTKKGGVKRYVIECPAKPKKSKSKRKRK